MQEVFQSGTRYSSLVQEEFQSGTVGIQWGAGDIPV